MTKEELRKKVLSTIYKQGFRKNGKKVEDILKIKKPTLDYVLERLHEEKYYSRERYEINFDSVGLGKFAWLFISVNWDSFEYKEFIKKVLSMPQVSVIADVTGNFDLAIKIFGPSIQSLNSFILGFEKIFENHINNSQIIFGNKEFKRHYIESVKCSDVKLSKIDYRLLCKKNKNPKLNGVELSKILKIHRNTISTKWKLFWTNHVILKKTIELTEKGYNTIGLGIKAFIIITPCPGKGEEITKTLNTHEDIQDLFTTLSNDIVLIVRVATSQDLAYFYKTFSKIEGCVKETNTIIFLTKHTKTCLTLDELKKIIKIE